MNDSIPAIEADRIRKAFGPTVAVGDVSFRVEAGRVHALLGENGAGKSTIVKLLSGLMSPDTGQFRIFGAGANLSSPRAAHAHGIQTAFQEMTLIRDLTVVESVLMPYAPVNPLGIIRRRAAEESVRAHFAALNLGHIDLREEIVNLDLAIKQKIEIARAIYRKPKILLLDEPTSSLTGRDVDWLGDIIAQQKAAGVTTIFISHRLKEVRDFCDTLSVLRNGQHIASGAVASFDDEEVIRMIVGRSIGQAFPERPARTHESGPEVLRVERLATSGKLRDASFSLKKGEILGVAGLQGMGQLDLFAACFGMIEVTAGQIFVDGEPVVISSPADAVRADIGISLVPEDRKTEALFLKLTGTENASLPVIDRFTRFGFIDTQREKEAVAAVFQRVEVADRALWTKASAFSGGNQQKIAIAKWLLAQSRVLLLYDPTRGIDVGTKHELYRLMREYAEAGGAILLYSTEIPELVHLADRVMVLYRGRIAQEILAGELTEDNIVRAALGGATNGQAA
ncbi:sugar ABC transporter ATP-binding protein [Dongia sp.]|uniref:sugar ABC transporter ATP-binding protein n=1 Tax=Dongia sp. TaxID=1977262 RepID=UPI0035AFAD52